MSNTNSFDIPKPQPATGPQVNQAIAEAWAKGEIKIKPAIKYKKKLPPDGCEWYRIVWIMNQKKNKTVMYNGAYALKTAFKNEHLADNAMLMGFLLSKLAEDMQRDEKGLYPKMQITN